MASCDLALDRLESIHALKRRLFSYPLIRRTRTHNSQITSRWVSSQPHKRREVATGVKAIASHHRESECTHTHVDRPDGRRAHPWLAGIGHHQHPFSYAQVGIHVGASERGAVGLLLLQAGRARGPAETSPRRQHYSAVASVGPLESCEASIHHTHAAPALPTAAGVGRWRRWRVPPGAGRFDHPAPAAGFRSEPRYRPGSSLLLLDPSRGA